MSRTIVYGLATMMAIGLTNGLPAAPTDGGGLGGAASPGMSDDLLLEGLDDLLGDAEPAPKAEQPSVPRGADAPSWLPNRKELDRLMKESLDGPPSLGPGGEDVGESPLVTVRSRMDEAGRLIAAGDSGSRTRPAQDEVIRRLDELIKKMEQQCQNCQSGQPQQGQQKQQTKRSKPSQANQQAAKPGKPSGKPSDAAAQQSSMRLTQAEAAAAAERRQAEIIKRVWGRLPERLREQMLQSTSDEYLPEYRAEIERYFERLAEEPTGE